MRLTSDKPLRDECWALMGQAICDRLLRRAGPVLEWWARQEPSDPDRRPYAVVFGEHALCIAEPRINTEHRPVYSLSAYEFDPSSFRHTVIDHRPQPASANPPGQADTPGPGSAPAAPDLGLPSSARALLGNLPGKAQELLQAPFLQGQEILRCDWHYEGKEQHLNMFMVYLAGPKDVAVASGTKMIPVGHTAATAHWNLVCRRAAVIRRVGK
jgi:hypothetical protein